MSIPQESVSVLAVSLDLDLYLQSPVGTTKLLRSRLSRLSSLPQSETLNQPLSFCRPHPYPFFMSYSSDMLSFRLDRDNYPNLHVWCYLCLGGRWERKLPGQNYSHFVSQWRLLLECCCSWKATFLNLWSFIYNAAVSIVCPRCASCNWVSWLTSPMSWQRRQEIPPAHHI